MISPHFLEGPRFLGAFYRSTQVTETEKEPDQDWGKRLPGDLEKIIQPIPKEGAPGQRMGCGQQTDLDFGDQKQYLSQEKEEQPDRQSQHTILEKEPRGGEHEGQQEGHVCSQSRDRKIGLKDRALIGAERQLVCHDQELEAVTNQGIVSFCTLCQSSPVRGGDELKKQPAENVNQPEGQRKEEQSPKRRPPDDFALPSRAKKPL